jgi:undecaprenyl-diphosphatase
MNWFEALILGLVQGLTEFLPVSSTGHLEIADAIFGIKPAQSFYFMIVVHGATVLSTIIVFWKEILKLVKGSFQFRMNEETVYLLKIIVSMIPAVVAGLFFKDFVEGMFSGNLTATGIEFLITALLLALAHFVKTGDRDLTYLDSFIIGIAQAVAIIPAISRSGATIATGLLLGNRKKEITKFSFLMVLVPIIGANMVEITRGKSDGGEINLPVLLLGFIVAFVSGYFACKWMINLVNRSKMIWFAIYCTIIGLLSIILA